MKKVGNFIKKILSKSPSGFSFLSSYIGFREVNSLSNPFSHSSPSTVGLKGGFIYNNHYLVPASSLTFPDQAL